MGDAERGAQALREQVAALTTQLGDRDTRLAAQSVQLQQLGDVHRDVVTTQQQLQTLQQTLQVLLPDLADCSTNFACTWWAVPLLA